MENFIYMLAPLLSMKLFIILFLGTLIGLILGVLPGLGPTTGGALILPFTIPLEPLSAIILRAEKSALSTAKYLWNFLTGMAVKHNIPMQVAA